MSSGRRQDEPFLCIGCGRACELVTADELREREVKWEADRLEYGIGSVIDHTTHAHYRCPGQWCNLNHARDLFLCGPDRPGLARPHDLPGWTEAVFEALQNQRFPEEAFLLAGDKLADPAAPDLALPLTPEAVARFSLAAYQHASADEQVAYCTYHAHFCYRGWPDPVPTPFDTVSRARAGLRPPASNLLL